MRLSRENPVRMILLCLALAVLVRLTAPRPAAEATGRAVIQPLPSAPYGFGFGFGGTPVIGTGTVLDLGQTLETPDYGLVPDAAAAEELRKFSCLTEAPPSVPPAPTRPAIADDLPGFYGAPWVARLRGNLVAVLGATVPRDPLGAVPPPAVQVYRHYDGTQTTPSFAATPAVSVYRGGRAVLLRLFLGGPVRCIDLVVPNDATAGIGYVYYPVGHRLFEARGVFTIQK